MRPPVTDFISTELGSAPTTTSRSTWSCRAARASGSGMSRATATSTACRPIRRSTRATATRRSSPRWSSRRSKLTLTSRAFRNDQLAPFYEELAALTGSHKVLPMNSGAEAVETRDQGGAQMGLRGQGRARGQGRDHRLRRQFPRPHPRHRRLLDRSRRARRLRAVRAGLRRRPVRRRRRARGGDHAEHRRLPGRADPGRGRRHHPAGRLFHARCASSAPRTTSR